MIQTVASFLKHVSSFKPDLKKTSFHDYVNVNNQKDIQKEHAVSFLNFDGKVFLDRFVEQKGYYPPRGTLLNLVA